MKKALIFNYIPLGVDVVISDGEDGFFVASCPSLKGCHSQGETIRGALDNIEDAILGYLFADEKEVPRTEYVLESGSYRSTTGYVGTWVSPAVATSAEISKIQYTSPHGRLVAT